MRDGLLHDLGMQADHVGIVNALFLRFGFGLLLCCHGFPLVRVSGSPIEPLGGSIGYMALLQVELVEIFLAVLGDVALAALVVVAEK